MGYHAENTQYFDIPLILSRITVFIEVTYQHTYFISLPFTSMEWRGFKSCHKTIGGCVSCIRSLLDFN